MARLHIGFIGLGLIGGSIARALREKISDIYITAYDVNAATLTAAGEDGVIDRSCEQIDTCFSDCDYLFLCAPVQKNDANLEAVKKVISPSCILTDVGSVKTDIHEHIERAGLEGQFIGGHPMAGSERFGYANSKARLLENAYYILTPTQQTAPERLADYRRLVETMGAIPLVLDYRQHDYITAGISHLPHVIAASLVNLVRDSDNADGIMKLVAAGGFKDITRIASSSAAMWQQICLTNSENISDMLGRYIDSLTQIKSQVDAHQGDALYRLFDSARIYRDSFINASSGPIKRVYSFNIDIDDRPGMLAQVATTLAFNNINIKNIGIVHNREFEEGVLRIEFYDEQSQEAAVRLLSSPQFVIHEKKL
ncbi:MAG: prephenate dehydrogenase/arogenate dehydrogenase family protein [bacterium]|nr:prephenate dehydrogenase/arogenate dehydrogenase family protein [bacterium]MCM1376683.1 prephenate dehydrogenase/arogenate dehydrogenase family protein [Muribaculum sp.]